MWTGDNHDNVGDDGQGDYNVIKSIDKMQMTMLMK